MKRNHADGETIFEQGEPSDAAYVIVDGRVRLSRRAHGSESVIAHLGAGEMFGEMGLFDRAPRAPTARAAGAVTAEVIPAQAFPGPSEGKRSGGAGEAADREQGSTGRRLIGRLVGVRGVLWPERLGVRVAGLAGDQGGTHTRRLVAALKRRPGIRVRFQDETITLDVATPIEARAPMAAEIAREYLGRR